MSKKRDGGKKTRAQRVRLRGDASEEAALHLEAIAQGMRSGAIRLPETEGAIEVPTGSDLTWEVKARSGRRKWRIDIKVRWRPTGDDDDKDNKDAADTEGKSRVGKAGEDLENPAW